MLATFKETYRSVLDKTYGNTIIQKPFRSVLWYWSKYILLFSILLVLLLVFFITYFVPQLTKIARDRLPEITLQVNNGDLSIQPQDEFIFGNNDFRFIVDLDGKTNQLDTVPQGLLVLKDQVVIKGSPEEDLMSFDYKKINNFELTKQSVIDWIGSNQTTLYLVLIGLVRILAAISTVFYWTSSLFSYVAWSVAYFFIAKLIKKPLKFMEILQLTIYASVPSVVISSLLSVYPNQFISIFNPVLFAFFFFSWTLNIQSPVSQPAPIVHVNKTKRHKKKGL